MSDETTGKPIPDALVNASESFADPKPYEDRNETIKIIRDALKRRSGKPWSVTGGRGTAWGWIRIDAPPARRTFKHREKETVPINALNWSDRFEEYDSGEPGKQHERSGDGRVSTAAQHRSRSSIRRRWSAGFIRLSPRVHRASARRNAGSIR